MQRIQLKLLLHLLMSIPFLIFQMQTRYYSSSSLKPATSHRGGWKYLHYEEKVHRRDLFSSICEAKLICMEASN